MTPPKLYDYDHDDIDDVDDVDDLDVNPFVADTSGSYRTSADLARLAGADDQYHGSGQYGQYGQYDPYDPPFENDGYDSYEPARDREPHSLAYQPYSSPRDRYSSPGRDPWPPRSARDSLSSGARRPAAGMSRSRSASSTPTNWRPAAIASVGSLLAIVGFAAVGSPHSSHTAAATGTGSSGTQVPSSLATVSSQVQSATPLAATGCASNYTVRDGDYWIRIATQASVSLDQLLAANHTDANAALHPGEVVCLPGGSSIVATPATLTAATTPSATVAPVTTVRKVTPPTPAPVKKKKVATSHSSR